MFKMKLQDKVEGMQKLLERESQRCQVLGIRVFVIVSVLKCKIDIENIFEFFPQSWKQYRFNKFSRYHQKI